jgi:DeoR family L-fucose operon activator
MLPLERHRLIVELLGQRGVMRVNEIAQATRVSRETIRRDLSELERKGILNRSHGGALAAENPLPAIRAASPALPVEDSQGSFQQRTLLHSEGKCALPAKRCSVSSRDRPSSWTAAAPAGFWPGRCRRWR